MWICSFLIMCKNHKWNRGHNCCKNLSSREESEYSTCRLFPFTSVDAAFRFTGDMQHPPNNLEKRLPVVGNVCPLGLLVNHAFVTVRCGSRVNVGFFRTWDYVPLLKPYFILRPPCLCLLFTKLFPTADQPSHHKKSTNGNIGEIFCLKSLMT